MADLVLCAVDDSEAAEPVLDTARWLTGELQAELVVVCVVGGGSSEADELVGRVRAGVGGGRADVRTLRGSPGKAIQEAADREDADFLVVGSRGRGGLHSTVLGSVSRKLVMEARCPVVVVPPGVSVTEGGARAGSTSVVCGVDGSDQALAGAAFAGRLARRLGWRLVIVHARQDIKAVLSYPGARSATPPLTGQSDAVEKLAAQAIDRAVEASGMSATTVIEPGPPKNVLESVADREGARMIVIAARGVGGVRASLLGSVAAQLTASAARPVLVLSDWAAGAAESPRAAP